MFSERRPRRVAHRAVRLALVMPLAVLGGLGGCGKQGDPEPRPRAIPQSGRDLTVRQRGTELLFEVSYPQSTVAGLPIEGLASATLYEAVMPALVGQKAPSMNETQLQGMAKPVVELSGATLDAAVAGNKIRFKIVLPESALATPLPPPPPPAPTAPGAPGAPTAPTPPGAVAPAGVAGSTPPATAPAPGTTPGAATTPPAAPASTPAPTPAPTAPPAPSPAPAAASTPAQAPTPAPPAESAAAAPAVPAAATPAEPDAQARVYAVRTKERRGLDSPWSNAVGLVPLKTPPAPGSFRVEAQKEGVSLSWTASEKAIGYSVLRRDATASEWGAPIATLPAKDLSYLDRSAAYGSRYVYSVVAVARTEPPSESAAQSAHEIEYRDRFAPAPPTELRALYVSGEVRLVWEGSPDTDLRGYRIERAAGGGPFQNPIVGYVTGSDATDPNPPKGILRYRLTAVDHSGNATSSETVEIEVP